jgi:hypothetical protein
MRRGTVVFAATSIVLGAVILVRTALAGGGAIAIGYVFGAALIGLGIGRLYLLRNGPQRG